MFKLGHLLVVFKRKSQACLIWMSLFTTFLTGRIALESGAFFLGLKQVQKYDIIKFFAQFHFLNNVN